jgi:2-keto-4-pentenoate hydratase/2-oxohepta-3-ene-1,7-dioic acid hydratase in catechol pathway
MKLVSFALGGTEQLGVVDRGRLVRATDLGRGVATTMAELLARWPASLETLRVAWDTGAVGDGTTLGEVELLAPVVRPGKIACAGVNYRDHASEQNREAPDHPVMFAKFATSVVGDGAEIRWSPKLTQAVDFEAELAVVIGATCRRVSVARALDYVAGYTCLNDVSARDLQYSDKQFVRAKSLDTFCPMGPWLVTADEIPDPQTLDIRCLVNGVVMQDSNTSDMVFGVAELISFCSQAFTLEPGDVIATGTPGGVGWFREPKQMLKDGDDVIVEIERLGRLVNRCVETNA